MKEFINQIPIFAIKGFILLLGAGLIFTFLDWLGITIYMDHLYPKIMSVGIEIRILVLMIVGVIAHYTFWQT
tara:strand:- start:24 stop:239 length:216 start_codon:yes stop_codon:yes gene_type:complete